MFCLLKLKMEFFLCGKILAIVKAVCGFVCMNVKPCLYLGYCVYVMTLLKVYFCCRIPHELMNEGMRRKRWSVENNSR